MDLDGWLVALTCWIVVIDCQVSTAVLIVNEARCACAGLHKQSCNTVPLCDFFLGTADVFLTVSSLLTLFHAALQRLHVVR